MTPRTHLADSNGYPKCGAHVKPNRLRNTGTHQVGNRLRKLGELPTCATCLAIYRSRRKSADPLDTAGRYGKWVD